MYAVRWGLVDHRQAGVLIEEAIKRGEIDRSAIDPASPFGFLEENGRPIPLTEAAYRFCRHAPGMDVILTGTSRLDHLEDNIRAIQAPPLPAPVLDRLRAGLRQGLLDLGEPADRRRGIGPAAKRVPRWS